MEYTNIHNAKTHLSRYLKKVLNGEEVVICSYNKPIAKLIPYHKKKKNRVPVLLKDKIQIHKNFDN